MNMFLFLNRSVPGASLRASAHGVIRRTILAIALGHASTAVLANARPLVVLELFQSQGCSSCPPANANLNAIADHADILALSYAVTYWDRLGWKDIFAAPEFTARQYDYARYAAGRQVGTPQIIINGRDELVGADRAELDAAIAKNGAVQGGPDIATDGALLHIGAAPTSQSATVWLVRFDPRLRQVAVGRGENAGNTLPHRNIVRELVRLGEWSGRTSDFQIPAPGDAILSAAVLLQSGAGGPIIAARRL